jgi:hypothetical protein
MTANLDAALEVRRERVVMSDAVGVHRGQQRDRHHEEQDAERNHCCAIAAQLLQ